MDRLRQLIHEFHRRSIWQVLSVYLVGSWVALQVVEVITESAGLPDWAQPFALILLVLGLPVVLATAIVQEGVSGKGEVSSRSVPTPSERVEASPEISAARASAADGGVGAPGSQGVRNRLFTWKNAIAGGVAAFALLGILVAGYFIMWSTGIGPVGSLAAQGVFEEGDAVVLAQFENTSDDESLGDMVTEALRVDLSGSSMMTLVEQSRVEDALRRMGRTGDEAVDAELAREVAIRDGFKAVIHGTVGSAGSGYLFVAFMQAAETGAVLATFREAARGPDEVIDAIDKLSQDIREKAGESLRVIKAEGPLEKVSTPSLEALRKYVEGERLGDEAEYDRAIAAIEEAIELDPEFAMAYRKLAVLRSSAGESQAAQAEAATKAYELRDRLTRRERYLAEAYYHNTVTWDLDAEIQAYETVLEAAPDDQTALNNIALALLTRTRLDEAIRYLERAVNGPGASSPAFTNLPQYLAMAGRHEEAETALSEMVRRYPGRSVWESWDHFVIAAFKGDGARAHAAGEELLSLPQAQGAWKNFGSLALAVGDALRGRFHEAHSHSREAIGEARAAGLWDLVLYSQSGEVALEILLGREGTARELHSRMDLDATLDSASPAERDYQGVLWVRAMLGLGDGVEMGLKRWSEDDLPTSTGPAFEETQSAVRALLAGQSDPGQGLEALNALSRDMNCPGCFIWERADFAQKSGQLPEARDLFISSATVGSGDYLLDPVKRVLVHERLGEVFEALGEPEKAAEHYGIFATAWAGADEDLQPRVQAAREKAAALGGNE